MASLSVGITLIAWILAIYPSWLLASSGLVRINIPDRSLTSVSTFLLSVMSFKNASP